MSTEDEDTRMHIDAIRFLRLLPPNREEHPAFDDGVALFCGSDDDESLDYLFTISREDAQRIANDLQDFLAGKIDIKNPKDNYGRE